MSINWSYFIQAIEEEGVPNFTPDGKEIWNMLDESLIRIFQHKYTKISPITFEEGKNTRFPIV